MQKAPEVNNSIKMEVGIEDCLHIEFEYAKSKYHLKVRFLPARLASPARRCIAPNQCSFASWLLTALWLVGSPRSAHSCFNRLFPPLFPPLLQDVVVGKIFFLLVRIKIKHMEIELRRRESSGSGTNTCARNYRRARASLLAQPSALRRPRQAFLGRESTMSIYQSSGTTRARRSPSTRSWMGPPSVGSRCRCGQAPAPALSELAATAAAWR